MQYNYRSRNFLIHCIYYLKAPLLQRTEMESVNRGTGSGQIYCLDVIYTRLPTCRCKM